MQAKRLVPGSELKLASAKAAAESTSCGRVKGMQGLQLASASDQARRCIKAQHGMMHLKCMVPGSTKLLSSILPHA